MNLYSFASLLRRSDLALFSINRTFQVYAPIARHGVFPDRGSEQFNVRSKFLETYEGLCQLENSVNVDHKIQKPRPNCGPDKTGYVSRKNRQEWDLKEVHEQLLKVKSRPKSDPELFLGEKRKRNAGGEADALIAQGGRETATETEVPDVGVFPARRELEWGPIPRPLQSVGAGRPGGPTAI